jgi:sugar phosphate isomerase/epimerase
MHNAKMLITDWGNLNLAVPLAARYQVGLEVQEFTNPANLNAPQGLLAEISENTRDIALLSMHGPFSDLIPASRDPLIRQVTRDRFLLAGELAERMSAQHLILHSGFIPKTYPNAQWLRNSLEFWMDLLNHIPFEGEIHVENVYEDDFVDLRELVDRVNGAFKKERLSICLDIGHVNANSSKTFEAWITGLGDRIRYVHIHNNGGVLDDHWRLDQGTIQINQVLELLKKHAPNAAWTIETPINDLEPSLQWMQERDYLVRP